MVIALIVLLTAILALIVGLLTAMNWWAHSLAARRAREEAWRETHRPDGLPYPPAGRGMCDRCEKAFDKVYHMPAGNRLCPACYEIVEMHAPPCDTAETGEKRP